MYIIDRDETYDTVVLAAKDDEVLPTTFPAKVLNGTVLHDNPHMAIVSDTVGNRVVKQYFPDSKEWR